MPCNCKKTRTKEAKQDLDSLKQKAQELEKLLQELKARAAPKTN